MATIGKKTLLALICFVFVATGCTQETSEKSDNRAKIEERAQVLNSSGIDELVEGIHHFRENVFEKNKELFKDLDKGQWPKTMFITCSDSRIDPATLLQAPPGSIFVLRNAGNLVPRYDQGEWASASAIEYGIEVLGVEEIVVCGHYHCGAMDALITPPPAGQLPAVEAWLENADGTARVIKENYGHYEGEAKATVTVEENVLVQIENLRTHPSVAKAMKADKVRMHGWVYRFEAGQVFAYDPEKQQFESIESPKRK